MDLRKFTVTCNSYECDTLIHQLRIRAMEFDKTANSNNYQHLQLRDRPTVSTLERYRANARLLERIAGELASQVNRPEGTNTWI